MSTVPTTLKNDYSSTGEHVGYTIRIALTDNTQTRRIKLQTMFTQPKQLHHVYGSFGESKTYTNYKAALKYFNELIGELVSMGYIPVIE